METQFHSEGNRFTYAKPGSARKIKRQVGSGVDGGKAVQLSLDRLKKLEQPRGLDESALDHGLNPGKGPSERSGCAQRRLGALPVNRMGAGVMVKNLVGCEELEKDSMASVHGIRPQTFELSPQGMRFEFGIERIGPKDQILDGGGAANLLRQAAESPVKMRRCEDLLDGPQHGGSAGIGQGFDQASLALRVGLSAFADKAEDLSDGGIASSLVFRPKAGSQLVPWDANDQGIGSRGHRRMSGDHKISIPRAPEDFNGT